ncbi:hypothetical protein DFH28DRAFT_881029 [Melampsora americana]|nr:hypothetical protein DFH28DRAFT_881029 [Melampsora americana]
MLLVERVCQYLKKQNSDTKSFLLSYLRSPNEKIVTRRKQWGSVKHGWDTTEQILDEIDKVVNQKVDCQAKWNEWVLKKAKVIVAQQNPPQGSLFININKLETNFFEHQNKIKREETIVKSMSFMHELISFKLKHAHAAWKAERNQCAAKNNGGTVVSDVSESESDVGSESDACINPGSSQDSAQGYFFQKPKDRVENAKTRLKTEKAMLIKKRVKSAGAFGFLLCIDNLDMMERVHSCRIDATSKTFHGTWGYAHYLDPKIICDLNTEECTVATFQKTLTEDCKQAIDSGDLLPDQNEQKQWVLTLKNQVARVLSHYMKRPDKYKSCKILNLAPIDQVEAKKPDVDMLKLMDSSDNGSDGIAALYDKLIKQTGLLPEDFANRLQVIEGDLGTCLNFRVQDPIDMTPEAFESTVENVFMTFLSGHAMQEARRNNDKKRIQLLLRMQDFATGPGTNIKRLKDTFSLTVGLVSLRFESFNH